MTALLNNILSQFRTNNGEASVALTFADGKSETIGLTACLPYGVEAAAITDAASIEYVLVGGACWAARLSDDGSRLSDNLARAEQVRKDWLNEAAKLKAFYEKHKLDWTGDDSYDFYSDWHKEVFGYRPRGWNYDPLHNAF